MWRLVQSWLRGISFLVGTNGFHKRFYLPVRQRMRQGISVVVAIAGGESDGCKRGDGCVTLMCHVCGQVSGCKSWRGLTPPTDQNTGSWSQPHNANSLL